MQNIRTDIAAEGHKINAERGVDDGIVISEKTENGIKICKAEVEKGEGEAKSGRKAGVYLTAELGKLWLKSGEERELSVNTVKNMLLPLLPKTQGAVLVVGLGNEAITPDAIGPRTVDGLVVTHHMKALNSQLFSSLAFEDVAAVCPGVLGQTGIESARLIKSATEIIQPRCIVAVDALAARSLSRLGTTVQITDTGIAPGSGVGGGREELSQQMLGCPVIGIGVPTVVDAATLVLELSECCEPKNTEYKGFFVTPKDSDVMVRTLSKLLSSAINRALHQNTENIEEYAPL